MFRARRVDSFPGKDFDGVVEQVNRQAEFTPRNVQTVEEQDSPGLRRESAPAK